ncbi:hypothetical protein MFMK1_003571 [Metallumcola ferriviriculae]|uniref:Photosystem II reaction center X protein n=1 Tax=Metallumcola ferriviriculae TaxID=3039180 RepID=A0AAU0UTD1_9FIRM|nr:hypothetical protein MFMK1_003571 [Desulfitibacteraceae bacterium MK1]
MDVMGIIAFSTALPLAGSALFFAIIAQSKFSRNTRTAKTLPQNSK